MNLKSLHKLVLHNSLRDNTHNQRRTLPVELWSSCNHAYSFDILTHYEMHFCVSKAYFKPTRNGTPTTSSTDFSQVTRLKEPSSVIMALSLMFTAYNVKSSAPPHFCTKCRLPQNVTALRFHPDNSSTKGCHIYKLSLLG
jgi:hypothetical protein